MKRAFTLIEAIVVIVIILILAAILFPVFGRRHPPSYRRAMCQSNLKQIGLGFLQYVQDNNEKFPPARLTPTSGWADVLQPYIKSTQLFQCQAALSGPTGFSSDYFYNRNLARVSQTSLYATSLTLLSGDGADNAPTWNSIPQLPPAWTATSNSPSRRHLDVANYLFADGHVKSLPPSSIATTSPSQVFKPTFGVR